MADKRPENEFWLRRWLIRHSTLSAQAKLLLFCIVSYGGDNEDCFVGQKALADDLSLSDRQLRNVLNKLDGIVTVERRGRGYNNRYKINWEQIEGILQDRKSASGQTVNDRKPTSGQNTDDRKPASAQTGNSLPVQTGNQLPILPLTTQKRTQTLTLKERALFESRNLDEGKKENQRCEQLDALIDVWNDLPKGIASKVKKRDTAGIIAGWKTVQKFETVLELFSDVELLMQEIRESPFLHGANWFRLDWLFRKDKVGEWNIVKIMEGRYRDGKYKSNGRDSGGFNPESADDDFADVAGKVQDFTGKCAGR